MKKFLNISRSKSMESLVSNSKYFKFNPKINRGSQSRFIRTSVISQNFGERVTIRAAAFCTRWSGLITFLGKPYSNELQ